VWGRGGGGGGPGGGGGGGGVLRQQHTSNPTTAIPDATYNTVDNSTM
jgi:hypothetical protein